MLSVSVSDISLYLETVLFFVMPFCVSLITSLMLHCKCYFCNNIMNHDFTLRWNSVHNIIIQLSMLATWQMVSSERNKLAFYDNAFLLPSRLIFPSQLGIEPQLLLAIGLHCLCKNIWKSHFDVTTIFCHNPSNVVNKFIFYAVWIA